MLISVTYEKDKWVIDENTAMIYPEFREVIRDKTLGFTAMAYVALGCDPAEDNPLGDSFENEGARLDEAERCVYAEDGSKAANPKVSAAVAKYLMLTDTPYTKAKSDLNEALKNVGGYLKAEGKMLTTDNIGAYVGAMEKLPKVLLAMKSLNKQHNEEADDKPKVKIKADAALGYSTRQYLDK